MHRWDVTPREAVAIQRELATKVRQEPLTAAVKTIAAADCAFIGKNRIVAAAVLCDARTLKQIECAYVHQSLAFPYVPGLLSFREAPAVIEAVRQLRGEAHPAVQVVNCDLALAHGTGGLLGARHSAATLIMERV